MSITPLSEQLLEIKTKYSSDDMDWVKYVHDHYQTIFDSCKWYTIKPEEHHWENYRLEDYLSRIGVDPNIAWIVLYVNQLPSNTEFKELSEILLPDLTILEGLYESYIQIRSNIKACRNA